VQGKEVILGNLMMKEREAIVNQVSKKIGFQGNDKNIFLSRVKSSLDYYLPWSQLKCIANALDMMDYTAYTQYEIRKIYENDARDYITPKLKELGFSYMEPEPKKIGGFNIDIYATTSNIIFEALQKIAEKHGLIYEIDKFY